MEIFAVLLLTMAISTYLIWFGLITRKLTGPKVWPLVGNLPGLMANKSSLHDWIAGNLRGTCAGTYQTCICAVPFIARKQGLITVTCNPKNLEHILRSRFENYPKGPRWQAAFHELLGRGIFNSDGQLWLLQRKTAALEFTTRTLKIAMDRWVNRSIKFRLWRILEIAQVEHSILDIQDLLLRLTFDNICGLAFGKDLETLSVDLPANLFAAAFDKATEATLQRLIYPEVLWKFKRIMGMGMEIQLKKSVKIVDSYLTEIIADRKAEILNRSESVRDDLLSRFIKKKDDDGKSYSSTILREIVLNFILAGRDTSSVALSWFFWLLMKNPRVETKIIQEIVEVLKKTRGGCIRKWLEEPLCFEEVDSLVYLKAALSESLRLYPSVPEDSKYVISDDILPDGTVVPAGSSITYSIYSMGRMESIWGEDCLLFRPERWLSAGGDRFEPPDDHYKFVAFNAGPRTCLGKDLAYLQMKSIAAAVLLRHRVVLMPGHVVEQKMSLTLFMKNGLRVYVEPRVLPDVDDSRVDTDCGDDTAQA